MHKVTHMATQLNKLANQMKAKYSVLEDCPEIETKLAIALLLSQLIPADGKILEVETKRLTKLASRRFKVDPIIITDFLEKTTSNHAENIPVSVLADELKTKISPKQSKSFIRDLWDIALADDELHTLEEAMIYNVADHLGVSRRDVIAQQTKVCA